MIDITRSQTRLNCDLCYLALRYQHRFLNYLVRNSWHLTMHAEDSLLIFHCMVRCRFSTTKCQLFLVDCNKKCGIQWELYDSNIFFKCQNYLSLFHVIFLTLLNF